LLASIQLFGVSKRKAQWRIETLMRRGSVSLVLASLPAFEARSRGGALSIGEFDVYLKEIDRSQHHGSISLSLLW